jgi:hypothetical protein
VNATSPPPPTPPTTTTTTTTTTPQVTPPNVVVNHSIDGITIGESEQQVEQQLGKPTSGLTVTLPGGKKGRFERYRSHGALFLVTYDASGHVVSLETYSSFYRTAAGLGPGSALTAIAKLHAFHYDSCELGYWNGSVHTKPGGRVTVFTPDSGKVASILITQLRLYTDCANGSRELPPVATLALGHSIGGVSLGMGEAAVVKEYGKPSTTLKIALGGGISGSSVRYTVHGAALLITYDGAGKVVSIESYSPFFKTLRGIGPGSPLALVQKLHGFHPDYCELGYWNGTPRTKPYQFVTVFTPRGGVVASVLITELRLYTACATGSTELPPPST